MVPAADGLKDSGCLHCYAKDRDDRQLQEKKSHWGKGAPRLKHTGAVKNALAMNRRPWICDLCGEASASNRRDNGSCLNSKCDYHTKGAKGSFHRRRIFSLSLGDWLDNEVPIEWLAEMLDTIRKCDQVTWILCTKRPENFSARLNDVLDWAKIDLGQPHWVKDWLNGNAPKNIILLVSVENQPMADRRIQQLLAIPAACRGLSLEPLLGVINLDPHWLGAGGRTGENYNQPQISWFIAGGESGPKARPCDVKWIRSLKEQGQAAGVAVFVKQLGSQPVFEPKYANILGRTSRCEVVIRDKKGGDINEWPSDLRVQQWPAGF